MVVDLDHPPVRASARPSRWSAGYGWLSSRSSGALLVVASACVAAWALVQQLGKLDVPASRMDEWIYLTAGRLYVTNAAGRTPPLTRQVSSDNFEHPPLAKYLYGWAQEVAGHPSVFAGRVVAVTATLLCCLVLAGWLWRAVGPWCGMLAGALLALLPMHVSGAEVRFLRFATLEPVAMLAGVVAVALVWAWAVRPAGRGWPWAVGFGVAAGLAAGAKLNGGLAAAGPVLAVLALAARRRDRRLLALRGAQALLAAATGVTAFVALYLPLGRPGERIRYLLAWQSLHSEQGHPVFLEGRIVLHPPWWANLWFTGQGYGWLLTLALLVAVAAAVVLRRDLVTGVLACSAGGLLAFHCLLAGVALPFYWVLWQPQVLGLAAIGVTALLSIAGRELRARFHWTGVVAALAAGSVLVVATGATAGETAAIGRLRPAGASVLPSVLSWQAVAGPTIVAGFTSWDLQPLAARLPPTSYGMPASGSPGGYRSVVLGAGRCGQQRDPWVLALVAENLAAGRLELAYQDQAVTVFAVRHPLLPPHPAAVGAHREEQATFC